MAKISPRDEADLDWYFGEGITRFFRSTFGDMCARLDQFAHDSDGHRIPLPDDSWTVMSIKHTKAEPSYTPNDRDLMRFSRVSRAVKAVAQKDPTAATTLAILYGDQAARWGRDAALYAFTRTGSGLARRRRERSQFDLSDVRSDELLAQDIAEQNANPNQIRARHHKQMREEADELKVAAWRAWNAAVKRSA